MLPLWDDEPHRRTPVITMLLITANIAVFVWQLMLAFESSRSLAAFVDTHALVPARLVDHYAEREQWLTVFTSMFLHGSPAHVLGNCWFLWIFGNNVECRLGPFKFLLFYLLAGSAAAAAQFLTYPGSPIPMIGASGAISGVLGAYFILFPRAWIYTLVPWIVPIIPLPAVVFLFIWFALQAFNGVGSLLGGGALQGGVAWWAHAGGFVAGAVFTMWARKAGLLRRR
jgi:membrane associated rhomboid family serine protease